MTARASPSWSLPAVGAAAWCVVFAAVHLFWALGGTAGLASAAGPDLAAQRPPAFVVFGLFGVAALLLAGAGLVMIAGSVIETARLSRPANLVIGTVGVVLTIRGLALEALLEADVGGLRTSIGPLESEWSLTLWNPWFAIGGSLFLWTALRVRRTRRHVSPSQ